MITLGITVYNAEHYIDRTLSSVFNQILPFDRIIVVDDGSEDKTKEILKKYGSRIEVYSQKNKGISNARNRILSLVSEGYICFLDGDDILQENYVITLKKNIENKKNLIYHFNFNNIFPQKSERNFFFNYSYKDGKILAKNHFKISFKKYAHELKNMVWTYCFDISYLKENNLFFNEELEIFEDVYFLQKVYIANAEIKVINEVLVNYYHHENSITKKSSHEKYKNALSYISLHMFEFSKEFQTYIQVLSERLLTKEEYIAIFKKKELKDIKKRNYNYLKFKRVTKMIIMKIKKKVMMLW